MRATPARNGTARIVAVEAHPRRRARSARSHGRNTRDRRGPNPRRAETRAAGADRRRAGLRFEVSAARRCVRQVTGDGAGPRHRARRTVVNLVDWELLSYVVT